MRNDKSISQKIMGTTQPVVVISFRCQHPTPEEAAGLEDYVNRMIDAYNKRAKAIIDADVYSGVSINLK